MSDELLLQSAIANGNRQWPALKMLATSPTQATNPDFADEATALVTMDDENWPNWTSAAPGDSIVADSLLGTPRNPATPQVKTLDDWRTQILPLLFALSTFVQLRKLFREFNVERKGDTFEDQTTADVSGEIDQRAKDIVDVVRASWKAEDDKFAAIAASPKKDFQPFFVDLATNTQLQVVPLSVRTYIPKVSVNQQSQDQFLSLLLLARIDSTLPNYLELTKATSQDDADSDQYKAETKLLLDQTSGVNWAKWPKVLTLSWGQSLLVSEEKAPVYNLASWQQFILPRLFNIALLKTVRKAVQFEDVKGVRQIKDPTGTQDKDIADLITASQADFKTTNDQFTKLLGNRTWYEVNGRDLQREFDVLRRNASIGTVDGLRDFVPVLRSTDFSLLENLKRVQTQSDRVIRAGELAAITHDEVVRGTIDRQLSTLGTQLTQVNAELAKANKAATDAETARAAAEAADTKATTPQTKLALKVATEAKVEAVKTVATWNKSLQSVHTETTRFESQIQDLNRRETSLVEQRTLHTEDLALVALELKAREAKQPQLVLDTKTAYTAYLGDPTKKAAWEKAVTDEQHLQHLISSAALAPYKDVEQTIAGMQNRRTSAMRDAGDILKEHRLLMARVYTEAQKLTLAPYPHKRLGEVSLLADPTLHAGSIPMQAGKKGDVVLMLLDRPATEVATALVIDVPQKEDNDQTVRVRPVNDETLGRLIDHAAQQFFVTYAQPYLVE